MLLTRYELENFSIVDDFYYLFAVIENIIDIVYFFYLFNFTKLTHKLDNLTLIELFSLSFHYNCWTIAETELFLDPIRFFKRKFLPIDPKEQKSQNMGCQNHYVHNFSWILVSLSGKMWADGCSCQSCSDAVSLGWVCSAFDYIKSYWYYTQNREDAD